MKRSGLTSLIQAIRLRFPSERGDHAPGALSNRAAIWEAALMVSANGTAYKHGLAPINGELEKYHEELALAAIKLLQEAGMEKEDLARV